MGIYFWLKESNAVPAPIMTMNSGSQTDLV